MILFCPVNLHHGEDLLLQQGDRLHARGRSCLLDVIAEECGSRGQIAEVLRKIFGRKRVKLDE